MIIGLMADGYTCGIVIVLVGRGGKGRNGSVGVVVEMSLRWYIINLTSPTHIKWR